MPLLSTEIIESQLRLTWAIDARAAVVWEKLTTPSAIADWLGEVVAGVVSPGGSFIVDHGAGYRCESTVFDHAPMRGLAYTWKFPDEARTEVSWKLTAADGVTILELTHADLADMAASYRDGWITHLTFLEASALGSSLPAKMFWQIHATIACLNK